MGIFGTTASVIIDVNLILQIVILSLLVLGLVKRKLYKLHGRIMSTVALLTLLTILLIMGPTLFLNLATIDPLIYIHSAIGLIAFGFGFLFGLRFNKALREGKPLTYGTKNMMRLTFILWMISMLGGIFHYVQVYVLT